MMKVPFYIVNAFTDKPFKGNPAGVVLQADELDYKTMQKIAAELKFSETAFVMNSQKADYKVRFFTPKKEVDLCGHATVATFHVLSKEGILRKNEVKMETKAGVLDIEIKGEEVFMEQAKPIFKEIKISRERIAEALGMDKSEIADLPIEAVSTGLFSLNIPIKSLQAMQNMKPHFDKIKEICIEIDVGLFFPFTFETVNKDCFVHARCFAPLYGINEDPVTGTANGALGAYLAKHGLLKNKTYRAEQGCETGREGIVSVEVNEKVKIGGKACITVKGKIEV